MTSFSPQTSKNGYQLSPHSAEQQFFFHSNQKFVNVSMTMVYFVLATGLCINLSYSNAKSDNKTTSAVEG